MYTNNSDVAVSTCTQTIDDDITSTGESTRHLDYLTIESIFDAMLTRYCRIGINNDCSVAVAITVRYVTSKVDVIPLCIIDSYRHLILIRTAVYIGDGQAIRSC